ncbi:hypothetical protein HGRIS_013686 [Hohenbuehelia grisea]|uniref:Hydrophobin n=1 Tax=Hohenbuehelia grisea TaxID=104357 RepID=A0ABR3IWG0_9AGAR
MVYAQNILFSIAAASFTVVVAHNAPPPAPAPPAPAPVSGNCNAGAQQCCNSYQASDSDIVSSIFSILGEGPNIAGSTGQVGFACSPIIGDTGLGGSPSCQTQTACCSNTTFNGVIAIGCMPLSL